MTEDEMAGWHHRLEAQESGCRDFAEQIWWFTCRFSINSQGMRSPPRATLVLPPFLD